MELKQIVAERKNKKIYRSGDKLIKVFDKNFSKADILNEALNQARVEETGLDIPILQEVTKLDGKWTIVMDYIEGKTLEQLIAENPSKTDEYLKLFVDTQNSIHAKKSSLLTILNDKMKRKMGQADLTDSERYELNTRLAGFEQHDKVLHGDYQLSNVILGKDGKVYIIDWSHATQGNASADVAMSYLLMILDGKKELAEKYLEIYEESSGTSKHYVKQWVPIVAASHLKDSTPTTQPLLHSYINVVEY